MSLPEADRPIGPNNGSGHVAGASLRRGLGFAALALALLAPVLSACGDSGFRPLYGSSGVGGAAANEKMAQVQTSTIPGRVGQRIRNELIFQTTGGGAQQPAAYRLEVAIRESTTSTLIRSDGDARGKVFHIEASFQLIRLSDRAVVLKGNSYGQAAYERFTSIYANVRAQKDAEDRAAKTISEELKTRLAAYLSSTA